MARSSDELKILFGIFHRELNEIDDLIDGRPPVSANWTAGMVDEYHIDRLRKISDATDRAMTALMLFEKGLE